MNNLGILIFASETYPGLKTRATRHFTVQQLFLSLTNLTSIQLPTQLVRLVKSFSAIPTSHEKRIQLFVCFCYNLHLQAWKENVTTYLFKTWH